MEMNYFDNGQSLSDNVEEIREQHGNEQIISEPDFDPYGFYPDFSF